MKDIGFWILNKILLIICLFTVLFNSEFSSFEKCVLVLILGVILALENIKDEIKRGLKTSK